MPKNLAVRAEWRNPEALLNIFPVNDLVSFLRNDDYILDLSVTDDRSKAWLYTICLEQCGLLQVAVGQIIVDELHDILYACGFPFHGGRGDCCYF